MIDLSIYCCYTKDLCSSYRSERTINFRHISYAEGIPVQGLKITGICWFFVLSGSLMIRKGEEEYVVESGEMFILPSEAYILMANSEAEVILFTSDRPTENSSKVVKELAESGQSKECGIYKSVIHPSLDGFLKLLLFYLNSGISCEYVFEEKQEELFILMKGVYAKDELRNFLYSLTLRRDKDLKKFIEDNCAKAKNAQDLALLCGYSPRGFKRVFKEIFGEPVYRWMLQRKADCLRERLIGEDVNLKIIVDEFGFSSQAHFTKFCKQWLGMVPTKFIEEANHRLEN